MSSSRRRTVIYTLADGVQVGCLLRTRLFGCLTSVPNVRWVFLAPLADRPEFRRQFAHPRVAVEPLPRLRPKFLDRQLEYLLRELQSRRMDRVSARILYRRMRVIEPKRFFVHRPLAELIGQTVPRAGRVVADLAAALGRDRLVDGALDRIRPDCVVLGSGAVKPADAPIAHWARRRGVPLFGIIPSWDNLAIKGPTVRSDRIAVWNAIMRGEAVEMFDYRPEQIAITGPAQFDIYAERPRRTRDEFLGDLGLRPDRRLITYTTMPPSNSNFSAYFVHRIAAWIRGGDFAAPCQLLVRLHPQDDPRQYRHCADLEHVRIELPGRFRELGHWQEAIRYWDPTEHDVEHLRDTLLYSDVVVNIASTIALEAAALDRPIVNLAYNPAGAKWPVSIAEYYRLAHYRPVVESGAVRLARSPSELRMAIDEALVHPERRRAQRRDLYRRLATFSDGRCAERVAAEILRFVGAVGRADGELDLLHAA